MGPVQTLREFEIHSARSSQGPAWTPAPPGGGRRGRRRCWRSWRTACRASPPGQTCFTPPSRCFTPCLTLEVVADDGASLPGSDLPCACVAPELQWRHSRASRRRDIHPSYTSPLQRLPRRRFISSTPAELPRFRPSQTPPLRLPYISVAAAPSRPAAAPPSSSGPAAPPSSSRPSECPLAGPGWRSGLIHRVDRVSAPAGLFPPRWVPPRGPRV
jgi:hypothetical protein